MLLNWAAGKSPLPDTEVNMLKIYEYNGLTFQFEESEAPEGAVLIEPKPQAKKRTAANKSRTTRTKAAK